MKVRYCDHHELVVDGASERDGPTRRTSGPKASLRPSDYDS